MVEGYIKYYENTSPRSFSSKILGWSEWDGGREARVGRIHPFIARDALWVDSKKDHGRWLELFIEWRTCTPLKESGGRWHGEGQVKNL